MPQKFAHCSGARSNLDYTLGQLQAIQVPMCGTIFYSPFKKKLNEWKSVTIMVSCTTSDSTLLAAMYTHYICSVRDLTLMKHHWKRRSFFKCEIYYFENETIIKILRLLFFVTTLYEVVFIIFMSVNEFTAQFDSNKVGSSFFCKVYNAESDLTIRILATSNKRGENKGGFFSKPSLKNDRSWEK